MRIVDKTKNEIKKIKDLNLEDIFRFKDDEDGEEELFMKVSNNYDRISANAYNFSKSELTCFMYDTEVEVIPAELILHEKGWSEE